MNELLPMSRVSMCRYYGSLMCCMSSQHDVLPRINKRLLYNSRGKAIYFDSLYAYTCFKLYLVYEPLATEYLTEKYSICYGPVRSQGANSARDLTVA